MVKLQFHSLSTKRQDLYKTSFKTGGLDSISKRLKMQNVRLKTENLKTQFLVDVFQYFEAAFFENISNNNVFF